MIILLRLALLFNALSIKQMKASGKINLCFFNLILVRTCHELLLRFLFIIRGQAKCILQESCKSYNTCLTGIAHFIFVAGNSKEMRSRLMNGNSQSYYLFRGPIAILKIFIFIFFHYILWA